MPVMVVILVLAAFPVQAEGLTATVPMHHRQTGTYYVPVNFAGAAAGEMLLDTGSEYPVINEHTLGLLKAEGLVNYAGEITGVLADG